MKAGSLVSAQRTFIKKGMVINMAGLKIYRDEYANKTAVSNRFIDEYMADANDAQIKVYLYLLYSFQAGIATSISDLADKFNHTEKDIIRALKYWEKKKLLSLDYDEDKSLTGIRLKEIENAPSSNDEDSRGNFSKETSSVRNLMLHTEPGNIAFIPFGSDFINSSADEAKDEEATDTYEKPNYSTAELREFKNRENTQQLIFIVETYIGRPLTSGEIKSVLFFSDVLKFSDDMIDYLVQYCVDRGKKSFRYIEKVAVSWAQQGFTTPAQAQRSSFRYDKEVYDIMNSLGKNTSPTSRELEYINRWIKEYGFSPDIIFEACSRTVLATDSHRFEYAEGILSNWNSLGVHHKADIDRADSLYKQRKKSAPQASVSNKFNQFTQNSYDFDALEKELLSN